MLSLTGELIHTFEAPKGETKDGREYGGDCKIQILGEVGLVNGDTKRELITLTAHDIRSFEGLSGKKITVPVGVFVNGKNPSFFIPKGSTPSCLS